jgi:multicomponent K+:H+ antiporter subunit D
MNHLLVAPLLLPLAGGALALLLRGLAAERVVGITASVALLVVAIMLFGVAAGGAAATYDVGDWPVPYGITLVLDRLSATLLLVTALLAVAVAVYSLGGADRRGRHFHALLQFQLLGVNGAFLTGDLFNLFVFFEVLLIASYALLMHDSRPERTLAAIHVVVLNLVGSVLFLVAVGCIYSAAGSLNFADLAERAASLPPDRQGLWRAGGWLLLIVFALKAALLPLGFWLPGAYAAADGAVAALFAILTKVGVVAILRTGTLLFGDIGLGPVLFALALATLSLGAVGMLAARRLGGLVAHAVIVSVGTLLVAASLFSPAGLAAATYYLMHGTLATALLFLLADRIAAVRGAVGDRLEAAVAIRGRTALPVAFVLAAVAAVGLPPTGGFIAKVAVLEAATEAGRAAAVFPVLLLVSLLSIVALARAGSTLFWKSGPGLGEDTEPLRVAGRAASAFGIGLLLLALGLLAVFAGPALEYAEDTAAQLLDADGYVQAVRASNLARGGD